MKEEKKPNFIISVRFMSTILLFFGYGLNYMMKIEMGIAIVCMTNYTAVKLLNEQEPSNGLTNLSSMALNSSTTTSVNNDCPIVAGAKKNHQDGEFIYTEKDKGFILSAYFYGYIFTQIPGGFLSYRFGGRYVLVLSMLIGSITNLFIPLAAKNGTIPLFVCLFLTGMAHGATWPSISSFWSYWAPPLERARMVGFSSTGSRVGNIVALAIGGFLCVSAGWESIFYIFGGAGLVWSVLFFALTANTPAEHRFISKKEADYILEATRKSIETREALQSKVPWKDILLSKACWATFFAQFTHNWGSYLFMTQIPSYLKEVLKFDLKSNGLVSSIPYICCAVFMTIFSVASDKLLAKGWLSKKNTRRLFLTIGTIIPGFFILGLSFVTCQHVIIGVVLLSLGVGFDSVNTCAGYLVNMNDIAGPFAGIVFGISNTIATIPGIVSPMLTAVITKHHTQKEWQVVFWICCGIYFIGGTICMILLEATTQSWAEIKPAVKVISAASSKNTVSLSDSRSVYSLKSFMSNETEEEVIHL